MTPQHISKPEVRGVGGGIDILKISVVTVAIVSYSLHSILTEGAKSSGSLSFDVAAVVAVSELVKLLVTLFFLLRGNTANSKENGELKENYSEFSLAIKGLFDMSEQFKAAVPALLYAFNNQLAFWMLLQMDPGTMQLLSNFKVLPTVVLSVIFLQRKIPMVQYKALGLLLMGTIALHGADSDGTVAVGSTYLGLMQAGIYCMVSAIAGVWCEKVLREGSLHVQNMHLYIWGCVVNIAWLIIHRKPDSISGLASGWAIANILNQALTGLLISVVLKYAGNVDKIFIVAASVLPAGMASYFFFGYEMTAQWLVSACVIVAAIGMYVTKVDITYRDAVLVVGVGSVILVISHLHDEFVEMKLMIGERTSATNQFNPPQLIPEGEDGLLASLPLPIQGGGDIQDQEPKNLQHKYQAPSFEKFFPFHVTPNTKNNCITRQEISDISQTTRHLLSQNIRVFPRNGFLLGIIRHGGYLPNEHVDADMGIVSTDLDQFKVSSNGGFHAAESAFKLKVTENYWVNWKGLDPVTQEPYKFFGVNIHHGEFNMHANSVYPYRDTGGFFYPYLSVKSFNHEAAIADSIRYNNEGAKLKYVDTDERLNESNYQEGRPMGNIFNTPLVCFTEKQFYFTTIPVPCDYDIILTSLYGRNWNHVENRGEIGQVKEGKEVKFEAHAVSNEENEQLLWGGPRPMCLS